jgi:hypothetical protein
MTSPMCEPLKDETFCLKCGNVMSIRRPWWLASPVGECRWCGCNLTSALHPALFFVIQLTIPGALIWFGVWIGRNQ